MVQIRIKTVMLTVLVACVLALAYLPVKAEAIVVSMNQQINLGYTYNSQSPSGDAIYPAFNSDTMTIFGGVGGFTRHNLVTTPGGWWYQYVDLNLAGITTPGNGLDLSGIGATVSFETRYFQDPGTNTNPYGDAPVFLRLYTYDTDGNTYLGHRDYSIVYATQAPWSDPAYPTWTTVAVDVNLDTHTDGGAFDVTNVSRVRFYGTDWSGGGDDYVDFRNLTLNTIPESVPEPATMLLFGSGLIGLLVFRRKLKR